MACPQRRQTPRDGGFSIPELLVSVTLALLVLGTVASFNSFHLGRMQDQVRQNSLQMSARTVVDLFTREVRRAGMNPKCSPAIAAVADARPFRLQLLSDFDGDGDTDGPGEDVTYQYKFFESRFERTGNSGTDSLLDGLALEGSRLRYFDQNGVEIPSPSGGLSSAERAAVRRVRIELVATREGMNPDNTDPLRVELANDVEIRNRYFGNAVACP